MTVEQARDRRLGGFRLSHQRDDAAQRKITAATVRGPTSILGVTVFTFAAWLAVTHAGSLTGKIVLGVILGLILAAGVRALPDRRPPW